MATDGWQRKFEMLTITPEGRELRTLRDAIKHLAETIPEKERDMPQVMMAAEMLTRAAEGSPAWLFFARAATLQALHRHAELVFNPDRKDHHWGKRKLKRDE
jgi:hypothetical protein